MTLRGFTPDFKRSKAVFHINALEVIKVDILINKLLNLFTGSWIASVETFSFESTKEVFHNCIIIGTIAISGLIVWYIK